MNVGEKLSAAMAVVTMILLLSAGRAVEDAVIVGARRNGGLRPTGTDDTRLVIDHISTGRTMPSVRRGRSVGFRRRLDFGGVLRLDGGGWDEVLPRSAYGAEFGIVANLCAALFAIHFPFLQNKKVRSRSYAPKNT